MKYLLYCIVRQGTNEPILQPGIDVVAAHGLMAVVARGEETSWAPTVSSVLAFEKVVETIYARQPAVPVRYGCLMESEIAILRLLEDHHGEYEALLDRLGDMTEMGIRVLCPARAMLFPRSSLSPGAAYLASLRKRYSCEDNLSSEEAELADRFSDLLSGCYTEQRREISTADQGRLLSLYFLTPKTAVEQFRNQARLICPPAGTKLLFSGPWPPYNFAASAE